MPQLLSRMDDANWLTPSIAEILEQGAAPPGGDGSIQQQTRTLTQELSDLGTPARVLNVRPTPSHTLFVTRPDGGRTNRKVSGADIRRSLAKIAEQHREWTLGFLTELQQQEEGTVGILLRADQHQPVSLRRMLVRPTFRDAPSPMTLAMGLTLEEQLIIGDLNEVGHLLVIGGDKAKQHFIRAAILTLTLLNTPTELRVSIGGQSASAYSSFAALPHVLGGRILPTPDEGLRLLEGLLKEIQRRQQWFQENNVTNIDAYNQRLREQGNPQIQRILLVVDSLSDEAWQAAADRWQPTIREMLTNGLPVGIHLLLAADNPIEGFADLNLTRLVLRASANDVIEKLKDFPKPTLRFIDAFVVKGDDVSPVEMCAVTQNEIDKAVDYWRQVGLKRKQEGGSSITQETARVGLTAMLNPDVVNRAIAAREAAAAASAAPTPPIAPSPAPAPVTVPADQENTLLRQGSALAAYLGWISVGALRDVLGLPDPEARTLLAALQRIGVVENGDQPSLRFIRLAENPYSPS